MIMMSFRGVACLLIGENLEANFIFKVFSSLMREILHACWTFSLMRENLHAWRESGRNSVQAGDPLSMRESW